MRLSAIAIAYSLSFFLHVTTAWPGIKSTLAELEQRLACRHLQARQDVEIEDPNEVEVDDPTEAETDDGDSEELLGDLLNLQDTQLTPVGSTIKSILLGTESAESNAARYNLLTLPLPSTKACKADTCCVWQHISNEMLLKFVGLSGRCTNLARAAIRLGFHDAAGWSKNTGPGGGADGSLVLAPAEITRPENNGLQDIVTPMKGWYTKYKGNGISMADLVQMGATVATVTSPMGPRIKSYVGRKDSSVACTDGLLQGVNSDAKTLIKLFEDKTIRPHGLTALIGAHTTSQQRFVDPSRAGDPQDSSPGVWDVRFYKQTTGDAPPRVFRFNSDVALAQDSRISTEFQQFATDQGHWNEVRPFPPATLLDWP
jgi:hypothetical protein